MLHRNMIFALALATSGLGVSALAQPAPLSLPAPSPHASVSQTVGVTDITVDYSSPGVKGRKIYGGLLPYGELWRTGANGATKLTVSRDVSILGHDVPAGTYAIFTIPGADSWTFIVNKNPNQGGTGDYDQKLDVFRAQVKPEAAPSRERLTWLFANTTDDGTRLDLEWEATRISVPIAVKTQAFAKGDIDAYIAGSWRPLANAARYTAETLKDEKRALALADASIAVQETWYNVWVKATILAGTKDKKGAYKLAQRAQELGSKDPNFFYKDQVEKALKDWPKK
ncbi:MAG: DUF2911 domain-containing protein [Myxococcales bacterium]|nr:DUF2911 domain-containing protein [Myxococcales bacterium]MCB9737415.1 DUF2911 domain-containing protein [Deltaproteobacteria bacterium]